MSFSNTSPEVIMKFAQAPVLRTPSCPLFPIIVAGIVVSASNALSLDRPYLIAFIKWSLKSFGDLCENVVSANVTPASCNALGFVGA